MDVTINKSVANGIIAAPPSKSLAHRYIILAALSEGESNISNVDLSEDIKATLDCIKELGASVNISEDVVCVKGIGGCVDKKELRFYCRESGSTMRFFMGIAMFLGIPSCFYGSETLRKRPFGVYEDICKENGIEFERRTDHIFVNGKLNAGTFNIPGDISSQFITGLLFVLPLLEDDSVINLIPPVESKSYLDLTLQALDIYNTSVLWKSDTCLYIKGKQKYNATDVRVEGDFSNAAFLEAFNLLHGAVDVKDLNLKSYQGDRVYRDIYRELEAGFAFVDISDCPDLGPVLFAMAALLNGGEFTGTKRLKMKESDRGHVMCEELSKFGVESVIEENRIEIKKSNLHPATGKLSGHNDHRIVMALSLVLSVIGGTIEGAEAVRKSYPDYFNDIKKLGIEVTMNGMD